MSLRTATTLQAASRALVSADSQEMDSTAQVIKHTSGFAARLDPHDAQQIRPVLSRLLLQADPVT